MIANECGVTTVGDFRLADMSVGGQGAPLVPYLDMILLRKYYQETGTISMFLNIGGISNITVYLPFSKYSNKCPSVVMLKNVFSSEDKVIGFDCGPGDIDFNSPPLWIT